MEFKKKERYTIEDLRQIMQILRAPGGCPWDAEQTHESIRKNMIEEAYEAADAIDSGDKAALQEELGDVLMQVVFHAQMEEEAGVFTLDDVADGVCKKLVYRHPHVFGNVQADTSAQVLKNWEALKLVEKSQKSETESMQSIPRILPALLRAEKVQKKAARVGFDWNDAAGTFEKIAEETEELRRASESGAQEQMEEELGDLLFSVVNTARFLHVDPEQALTGASDKFIRRFSVMEQTAAAENMKLSEASAEQLEAFWNRAKAEEAKKS
ncbi:MAG: nucleoside triphosphate pyrophosphohydrolase [Firmicutes bacterium]|nr:nucleoside triphosphate pyrophosphohydrolase [Bacillota bacterium]